MQNFVLASRNLTQKLTFHEILRRFVPIIMEDRTPLTEVKALYERLQQVKRQVDVLFCQIAEIKKEIEKAERSNYFLNITRPTAADEGDNLTENDGDRAAKRFKYNFPVKDGYVVVYTDGACENNGADNAKAGIGVWFADNHPCNVSKPVTGKATNNTAEIQACIAALEITRDNGIKKVKIITDSQFTINSMTKWITGWKKKNWKLANGKSDVKNKTDFQKLDKLCGELDVQWEHVAGHSGIAGNEKADALARAGAKLYRR